MKFDRETQMIAEAYKSIYEAQFADYDDPNLKTGMSYDTQKQFTMQRNVWKKWHDAFSENQGFVTTQQKEILAKIQKYLSSFHAHKNGNKLATADDVRRAYSEDGGYEKTDKYAKAEPIDFDNIAKIYNSEQESKNNVKANADKAKYDADVEAERKQATEYQNSLSKDSNAVASKQKTIKALLDLGYKQGKPTKDKNGINVIPFTQKWGSLLNGHETVHYVYPNGNVDMIGLDQFLNKASSKLKRTLF